MKKKKDYNTIEPNVQYVKEPIDEIQYDVVNYNSVANPNVYQIVDSINSGVSINKFEEIRRGSPLNEQEWADVLNLSLRTLQRNKKEKDFLFKPIHSEKILELAEVFDYGIEVFEDKKIFYRWLNAKNRSLDNHKPSDLIKNSYGKELVMQELNKIEHGIFV
jgi:putative toxin-antitoxin system antitoxin component (TIGR02293 family)